MEIVDLGEKLPDPFDEIAIARGLFKIFALDSLRDSLQQLLRHVNPTLQDLMRGVHRLILVVADVIVRTPLQGVELAWLAHQVVLKARLAGEVRLTQAERVRTTQHLAFDGVEDLLRYILRFVPRGEPWEQTGLAGAAHDGSLAWKLPHLGVAPVTSQDAVG